MGGTMNTNIKRSHINRAAALFAAGALLVLGTLEGRQESSPVAAKVSAVLTKFPAESAKDAAAAAAELIALGPEGIRDVCGRLAAPGADDDSLARFALDAAAVHVGRQGAEAERLTFVKELVQALEEPREPDVKAFIIGELQLVGRKEAVKPLAKLLGDLKLGGPAARALAASHEAEAVTALLKSVDSVPAKNRVEILQALGELRGAEASKKIAAYAASPDTETRGAALFALANLGDPAVLPFLEKTAVTASPYERSRAASLYLLYARRQWENGNAAAAERICRDFVRNSTLPEESQARSSALTLLVRILGARSLDVLLEAAESSDAPFRQKALQLAEEIRGDQATARWVEALDGLWPENQADVIAMLGRRGDKAALPAVRRKIGSDSKRVSLAAAVAAARLGGDSVFGEVWPLVWSDDAEQVAAVREALSYLAPAKVVAGAISILMDAPARTRVALIEILAERKASAAAPLVLAQARSEDETVRRAALTALESLARPADLTALTGLLSSAAGTPDSALVQNALAAAAGQIPDGERRAEAVLAALDKAQGPARADLVRALSRIGGEQALAAVTAEMRRGDPQMQAAALYALSNWPDGSALEELWKTARTTDDKKSRYLALQGITRLTQESDASPERKLVLFKEALGVAAETNEKNLVLSALANVRTLESLRTVSRFLDDKACQARAAQAVLRLVMPVPGAAGWTGLEPAMILKKAILFIDSEYDRDEAERTVRMMLLKDGFSALFNGKDLSGWKGLVADPPKRAGMTPAETKKAQSEADALMRKHWKVVEGTLVFDGRGHSLCTLRDYGDFEMFVDWKIQPKGDSGIYLRGSPQVQIWDMTQSPDGSGGLYNNKVHPSKPLVRADREPGEWNTFYIKMIGDRVTVHLNGIPVADNVVMENYWERDKPIYSYGQIELQAHSTALAFRNIFLREIARPAGPAPAAAAVSEEGFTPLFNGKDLTGWTGDTKGYRAEDGAIVVSPEASGNLYTEREFRDFNFRFEFKLTPGANNGIGIRTPLAGDAAYAAMEIQVLDDTGEAYRNLQPYQYHGSIYGVVPAKRGALKPVGEWNSEEITVQGRRVTVVLNGTTIVDADIDEASKGGTVDHRDHPGLKNQSGRIGFLGHGTRVEFRNIRIRELGS